MQVLLPLERLELQLIKVTDQPKGAKVAADTKKVETKPQDLHKKITDHSESVIHDSKEVTNDSEAVMDDLPTLPDRVKQSNQANALFAKVREYLANPKAHDRPDVYLQGSRVENGLLFKENKLWVADDLRLDVIREVHDQPAVRYVGTRKTILLIQQHYFWPKMKKDVDRYIRNCHICRRAKAPRDRYNGTLKPLPPPERPWTDITMDFVPVCRNVSSKTPFSWSLTAWQKRGSTYHV